MGFHPRVKVEGLERSLTIARQVRNLGEDTRPLMSIAGSILEASVANRFDTQRGPGGVPWPPTQRQRRGAVGERGPVRHSILIDTGDLRDSLRSEVRPNQVEVGFDGLKNPVKAPANQFGVHGRFVVVRHQRTITSAFGVPLARPKTVTVRGHARLMNIPARPMLGIDDQDRSDLEDAWRAYLRGLFNG